MRSMRLIVIALMLATAGGGARASAPSQPSSDLGLGCTTGDGSFSRVSTQGPYDALPGELHVLDSDVDGQPIQVGLVRPDVPADLKVPVIAFASPYLFGGLTEDLDDCRPRLTANYVPHGYAVAFIPIRGTADSGDCMHMMGNAEQLDLDQAITWLGTQEWSNGSVGMLGVSYDGSTPWEVASRGNPHLKTIVPISGVNDMFHLMYRNGGNEQRGVLVLNALYYEYGFVDYRVGAGRSPERMVSGAACPEAFKGFGAAAHSSLTGERDPLGYWTERNLRPGVEQHYTGSILLVHGLRDWNVDPGHAYPWVKTLEAQGLYVKHLLGQWHHAWPDSPSPGDMETKRWDWADMLLDWFDHWLKGDTGVDLGARAEVQDSSGAWRTASTWPAPDAEPYELFLNPDGSLGSEPSEDSGIMPVAGLDTDPVRCRSCVSFTTEPLTEALRISGIPSVRLRVTPTLAAGHLTVRLYAGARQYLYALDQDVALLRDLVGWGQEDLRFPDGGETAQPVIPGMPIDLTISLQPLDAVIPAGERLTLVLEQGAYGDHIPSAPTAPVLIEVGGTTASLTLHRHEPSPASFFTPAFPSPED